MERLDIILLLISLVLAIAAFILTLFFKNKQIKREKLHYQKLVEHKKNLELAMQASKLSMWSLDVLQRNFTFDFRYLDIANKDPNYQTDLTKYYRALHPDDVERIQTAYYNVLNNLSSTFMEEYRILFPGENEYRWIASFAKVSKWDVDSSPLFLTGASVIVDEWHQRTK